MIINADCLDHLKTMPDNSIDFICTDPPYGYSFMGKDWDKAVPSVEIWKECCRVLKAGGFACIMSAPRSDVQQAMTERLIRAGFRLDFTPIYWTYASGFPKAGNIGKLVDRRLGVEREVIGQADYTTHDITGGRSVGGGTERIPVNVTTATSPEARVLDGSYAGFQPKPAVEVIIVAMKPLSEKTYVDQALRNGKGISWLDDGKIPVNDQSARFPANLLVSDDALNNGAFTKSTGNSEIPDYNATPNGIYGKYQKRSSIGHNDSGSYSRYFDLDKWAQTLPFIIVPKANKREKNGGTKINSHPTVKPLKLMSYLITLFSRPGDIVFDPFVGSGTTCIAAEQLGRDSVGVERDLEYATIAVDRLANLKYQLNLDLT